MSNGSNTYYTYLQLIIQVRSTNMCRYLVEKLLKICTHGATATRVSVAASVHMDGGSKEWLQMNMNEWLEKAD